MAKEHREKMMDLPEGVEISFIGDVLQVASYQVSWNASAKKERE